MKRLIALMFVLAHASVTMAQTQATQSATVTLSAFNIIRVTPGGAITLTIDGTSLTPGAQPAAATNNANYLQYTVIASSNRKITASIDANMPSGVTLSVVAAIQAGGAGTKGTAQSAITLSTTAGDLIKVISSCYTGIGATNGAQLTYTAQTDGTVTAQSIARTVTYTFAADT